MSKASNSEESLSDIFLKFLKFGFLAWGGPIAQIAMIRRELVEERQWVTTEKFNHALSIYQILPGPEAHELCVYMGMVRKGRWGGFLAGLGFMLPGFLLMLALTYAYVTFGVKHPMWLAVFSAVQPAVLGLIMAAVYRLGKHILCNKCLVFIAALCLLLEFLSLPFYVSLPAAGVIYVLFTKKRSAFAYALATLLLIAGLFTFRVNKVQVDTPERVATVKVEGSPSETFATGLKAGLLTFGGAYTAIPFVKDDAVTKKGWLTNDQFLDGLGLSGILPAPLIIFATFVGYFGGGWLGAILITIGIFVPAFLFTLIGHNIIERIIENKGIHNFLNGVTAGVIGLIAYTAVEFAITTTDNWVSVLITVAAALIVTFWKSKASTPVVILIAAIGGLVFYLI